MDYVRFSLLLVITVMITSVSLLSQSNQTITVNLSVFDHYTNSPLESALVEVIHQGEVIESVYTDVSGNAEITLTVTSVGIVEEIPRSFSLSYNYPNPFTTETNVELAIPEAQSVRVEIYNVLGQRVSSEQVSLTAGFYRLNFNMAHLPTGVYFLRAVGTKMQTVKLLKMGNAVRYHGPVLSVQSSQPQHNATFAIQSEEEYTIRVTKDRYDTKVFAASITQDMTFDVPMERNNEVVFLARYGNISDFSKELVIEGITVDDFKTNIITPDTLILKSGVYSIRGETDTTNVDREVEIHSVDTILVLIADEWKGIFLYGEPESPAIDATYDIDIPVIPSQEEISPLEYPGGIGRVLRTEVEISLNEAATIGETNELLERYNARIVSMLENIPNIVIRIPDPGSVELLEQVMEELSNEDIIDFVIISAFVDEEPLVIEEIENEDGMGLNRDHVPQIIPEVLNDIDRIDHHLAPRGHAAWNIREALPPLGERPWLLMADLWGGGAPDGHEYDLSIFDHNDFAIVDTASNHGYHVLGIITGSFDSDPNISPEMNDVTGIYPGTLRVRVVDILSEEGLTWPRITNLIIQRIKEILDEQPDARIVLNTSLNSRVYGDDQNLPALSWIHKVRGGYIETITVGAGLEYRFIHFTSAGNVIFHPQIWPPFRWPARNNSMFAFSALGDVQFTAHGISVDIPNLNNTFVVENRLNLRHDEDEQTRPEPGCASNGSQMGGNLSAMGTDVWSFTSELPRFGTGTSMATPQAAGIAAYAWSLNPELSVPDLKQLILRTAEERSTNTLTPGPPGNRCNDEFPQPVVDAYAAVIAAGGMNAIRVLLDVTESGTFNHFDVEAFIVAFDSANGALDYSRFDLNGDGKTGGDSTDRFDLNLDGEYSIVNRIIEGESVEFNEESLTDIEILCYWAYSDIYEGNTGIRSQLLQDRCGEGSPVANSIFDVIFNPPPPAQVALGDHVNFEFSYSTTQEKGVHIIAVPLSGNNPVQDYETNESVVLPPGIGQGNGYFTINADTVTVEEISFQMWDTLMTFMIYETIIPAQYSFIGIPAPAIGLSVGLDPTLLEGDDFGGLAGTYLDLWPTAQPIYDSQPPDLPRLEFDPVCEFYTGGIDLGLNGPSEYFSQISYDGMDATASMVIQAHEKNTRITLDFSLTANAVPLVEDSYTSWSAMSGTQGADPFGIISHGVFLVLDVSNLGLHGDMEILIEWDLTGELGGDQEEATWDAYADYRFIPECGGPMSPPIPLFEVIEGAGNPSGSRSIQLGNVLSSQIVIEMDVGIIAGAVGELRDGDGQLIEPSKQSNGNVEGFIEIIVISEEL